MKKMLTVVILLTLSSMSVFADHVKHTETHNIKLVTRLIKTIYETKQYDKLDQYIARDFVFYKNSQAPLNYADYKKQVIEQAAACETISILPLENIIAADNQVALSYTRICTDRENETHKKRVMAIVELNNNHKVDKITLVSHQES